MSHTPTQPRRPTRSTTPTWDNYIYLAVDIVLLTTINDRPHVLVIRRAADSDAYPGCWALPGGYLDTGERIEDAARRELTEETGLTAPGTWERIGVYDAPSRDPRPDRVISVAYLAVLPHPVTPRAGDDASDATWVDAADAVIGPDPLAFDHRHIVADALIRMRRRSTS